MAFSRMCRRSNGKSEGKVIPLPYWMKGLISDISDHGIKPGSGRVLDVLTLKPGITKREKIKAVWRKIKVLYEQRIY